MINHLNTMINFVVEENGMISWWWLIPLIGAFGIGVVIGDLVATNRCYNNYSKLNITPEDVQLSEARLEALWLSKTLEDIATYPHIPYPDFCKAERWREDANKWAKKIIRERIKEKVK